MSPMSPMSPMNGASRSGSATPSFDGEAATWQVDSTLASLPANNDDGHAGLTVTHRPGLVWSQDDFGDAFDVGAVSIIGELDPTGAKGVVEEVLAMFQDSLDPLLEELEHLRALGAVDEIRFQAHKLKSAAGQLGAVRLSAACAAILRHFDGPQGSQAATLDSLVDRLVSETVRVQRRLRLLLQG